ncbi:MAG: CHAT domain-containing protein [Planctomycetota bacterium]
MRGLRRPLTAGLVGLLVLALCIARPWSRASAPSTPAAGEPPGAEPPPPDAPAPRLDPAAGDAAPSDRPSEADLRAVFSADAWGEAQTAAYERLTSEFNALATRGPGPWTGPDGERYLELGDIYLWLFTAVPGAALTVADMCDAALRALAPTHGTTSAFARLLNRTAETLHAAGREEDALELLAPELLEAGLREGTPEFAWAVGTRAGILADHGRYGAAKALLEAVPRHTTALPWRDADVFRAWACSLLVLIECERGRVDWAARALGEQRALVEALAARSEPELQRGRALRARQLLLSELRVDNARRDTQTALARAGALMSQDGSGVSAEEVAKTDPLSSALRLQIARALMRSRTPERGTALAQLIIEAPTTHPIERAFCALLVADEALERGDLGAADAALEAAYLALAAGQISEDHVLRARVAAERARARRIRADSTSGAALGPPPPDATRLSELTALREALEHFRTAWRAAGDEPDGIGFFQFDYRRELLVEVFRCARAALGEQGAAQVFMQELAATQELASLTRELGAAPFDPVEATQRLRARNEGLVLLFPGRSCALLLVVDASGPSVFDLGPPDALLRALRALDLELEKPDLGSQRWRTLARTAAERVFPEEVLQRVVGWARVSWVQPELLGAPALDVLDVPSLGVIGLERPTATYPTLPAWLDLERRAERPRASSGAVALVEPLEDPAIGAQQGPRVSLTGTTPTCTQGSEFRTLARAEATLAAFSAAAEGRALALIWSHGFRSGRPGTSTGFEVTAPGGERGATAYGPDVARAFARAPVPRIVLLGICRAARSDARTGEDSSSHLGGTFLRLGADVVLASTRDVHAASSQRLIDTLVSALQPPSGPPLEPYERRSFSDALLLARRSVAAHPRFAHPHFWAALSALGVAHRTER